MAGETNRFNPLDEAERQAYGIMTDALIELSESSQKKVLKEILARYSKEMVNIGSVAIARAAASSASRSVLRDAVTSESGDSDSKKKKRAKGRKDDPQWRAYLSGPGSILLQEQNDAKTAFKESGDEASKARLRSASAALRTGYSSFRDSENHEEKK